MRRTPVGVNEGCEERNAPNPGGGNLSRMMRKFQITLSIRTKMRRTPVGSNIVTTLDISQLNYFIDLSNNAPNPGGDKLSVFLFLLTLWGIKAREMHRTPMGISYENNN